MARIVSASAQADTLLIDTGERLSGRVISDQGGSVVFESEALGPLTIRRERIARIEKSVAREDVPRPKAQEAEPVTANEPAEAAGAPSSSAVRSDCRPRVIAAMTMTIRRARAAPKRRAGRSTMATVTTTEAR